MRKVGTKRRQYRAKFKAQVALPWPRMPPLVMEHPHASFDDVIAACKATEIHEVIESQPNGYQTDFGERGTGLSGGQTQRIATARALLKRPKILAFAEATQSRTERCCICRAIA